MLIRFTRCEAEEALGGATIQPCRHIRTKWRPSAYLRLIVQKVQPSWTSNGHSAI